jgi:hypothetical protein
MGCDEERDFANRIVAERDAAIRELSAEKMWRDNLAMQRNEIRDERDALKARVAELEAASGGGEQPRGWLTEDEREIIAGIADDDEYTEEGQNIAKALLARSSPPEVVLPKLHTRCEVNEANNKSPCLWFRRPDVIKSLAAAGVAVKEVGRE